jgi:AraC-like DNA-binding protein
VFDERLLDLSPSNAEPGLHDLLRRLAEERIAELPPAETLTQRVRVLVSKQLGEGHLSAQHVAQLLHMSRRTLARRLEHEGTTFKAVVDEVRRGLAQRYLAIDDLGVSEIAPRQAVGAASQGRENLLVAFAPVVDALAKRELQ